MVSAEENEDHVRTVGDHDERDRHVAGNASTGFGWTTTVNGNPESGFAFRSRSRGKYRRRSGDLEEAVPSIRQEIQEEFRCKTSGLGSDKGKIKLVIF